MTTWATHTSRGVPAVVFLQLQVPSGCFRILRTLSEQSGMRECEGSVRSALPCPLIVISRVICHVTCHAIVLLCDVSFYPTKSHWLSGH